MLYFEDVESVLILKITYYVVLLSFNP